MPTPHRTVRVPDEIWDAARAVAQQRDETLTDVITRALVAYERRNRKDKK